MVGSRARPTQMLSTQHPRRRAAPAPVPASLAHVLVLWRHRGLVKCAYALVSLAMLLYFLYIEPRALAVYQHAEALFRIRAVDLLDGAVGGQQKAEADVRFLAATAGVFPVPHCPALLHSPPGPLAFWGVSPAPSAFQSAFANSEHNLETANAKPWEAPPPGLDVRCISVPSVWCQHLLDGAAGISYAQDPDSWGLLIAMQLKTGHGAPPTAPPRATQPGLCLPGGAEWAAPAAVQALTRQTDAPRAGATTAFAAHEVSVERARLENSLQPHLMRHVRRWDALWRELAAGKVFTWSAVAAVADAGDAGRLVLLNAGLAALITTFNVVRWAFLGTLSSAEGTAMLDRILQNVIVRRAVLVTGLTDMWTQPTFMRLCQTLLSVGVLCTVSVLTGLARGRFSTLLAADVPRPGPLLAPPALLALGLASSVYWVVHLPRVLPHLPPPARFLERIECVLLIVEQLHALTRQSVGLMQVYPVPLARYVRRVQACAGEASAAAARSLALVWAGKWPAASSRGRAARAQRGRRPPRAVADNADDSWLARAWEGRGAVLFYLDMVACATELCLVAAQLAFVCWRHPHPLLFLIVVIHLGMIAGELQKMWRVVRRFRAAKTNLQHSFEDVQCGPDSGDCGICLEELGLAKQLPCGHIFHLSCLRGWFEQSSTHAFNCPTCRLPLFHDPQRPVHDIRREMQAAALQPPAPAHRGLGAHGAHGADGRGGRRPGPLTAAVRACGRELRRALGLSGAPAEQRRAGRDGEGAEGDAWPWVHDGGRGGEARRDSEGSRGAAQGASPQWSPRAVRRAEHRADRVDRSLAPNCAWVPGGGAPEASTAAAVYGEVAYLMQMRDRDEWELGDVCEGLGAAWEPLEAGPGLLDGYESDAGSVCSPLRQ
ncbi:unnamed protein product [Pedinophyceae sp. YPF-701]|nr:unnamed protein product [Pedinophyceae sp. YPF-701]